MFTPLKEEIYMSCHIRCGCLCLFILAIVAACALAAEPTAAKKKAHEPAKAAPPAARTMKKGPLKIIVELDGVFEGETVHEIVVKPEEWSSLTVLSAVAHGARVRKGDTLLKLDLEKIDRAIADLRSELKISELAIHQGRQQLQAIEQTTPLDLEASQRAARLAEENQKFFVDVEHPFLLKAVEFDLKMAKEQLEYEEEELHQLEKMYKADDITEETEQIVLKRARDTVDRAKFIVQATQTMHDQAIKFGIPRRAEDVKEIAQRKSLEWEKSKVELPLALQKQRLELDRMQLQQTRTEERLTRLLADRELMTVESPADGIVYYGKFSRGKAADSTGMSEALGGRGAIQPNQVVMTIVEPRPMFIRATAEENQLSDLRAGLKGTATPAGYPELNLPVTLDDVSDIPISPGSFDARLTVDLRGKTKLLLPGMNCKVKLVAYLNHHALTVPPKAVITDELDDQKHSVQVLEKDGKTKDRPVILGRKTEKQVEIVGGLHEGDQVVLEPATEDK
jgi:multidrug resistance efflux pump